jgi:hypothetical protein
MLRGSIRREFLGAYEHTREVACGSLSVGGVLVPTCNGAEVAWPQGSSLLQELFELRKILLSREAGLSFMCRLYVEGDGGVEGV